MSLTPSASIALGLAFMLVGAINVWLVLEAWSRVKAAKASSRMIALHRIGGYVFIGLFCVMSYFMAARLRGGGADGSANVTIHLTLAMILSPLLFIKVLIARYYRNQHSLLMPIGLTIFVLAFVLIASTAGPYLVRAHRVERVSIDPVHVEPIALDLNRASDLMQKRCSKCHNLDRVVGARKDAKGWAATVERMRGMTGADISEEDAQIIVGLLASRNRIAGAESAATTEVARALVDQRCGRCHSLDRVYQTVMSAGEWRETVTRMVGYAAGSAGALQPGEDEQIISYLASNQSPDAAAKRKAEADAAASEGKSLIAGKTGQPAVPSPRAPASRYDGRTIGFVSMVFLAMAVLAIRRPGTHASPAPRAAAPSKGVNAPLILELVQITPQTPDSKTLRFVVRGEHRVDARPGQFLTFTFLFDGKKEIRCYSICSSAARSGYVEITPKRVNGGCVSVFLNDRAAIGMTVEATGPFGQFCLDPTVDRKIVLVAAGSGITPMIAMLRYIDDLCLDIDVTLLYCVRTAEDIMFRGEIEALGKRLKKFRWRVALSQPGADWTGARGHISREFVSEAVPEIEGRVFFLCGPPAFMERARGILTEAGVGSEGVRQETFGGVGSIRKVAGQAGDLPHVTFAKSGKTATAAQGETLLAVAAGAGVEIASACRQGQCGTCKTRVIEGEVEMSCENGLDAESKSRGFVLTCVGRAAGNVKLDA